MARVVPPFAWMGPWRSPDGPGRPYASAAIIMPRILAVVTGQEAADEIGDASEQAASEQDATSRDAYAGVYDTRDRQDDAHYPRRHQRNGYTRSQPHRKSLPAVSEIHPGLVGV